MNTLDTYTRLEYSVETALVILVGKYLTATEEGKTHRLLLLDPSAAFDTTSLSGAAASLTGHGRAGCAALS